MKTNSDLESRFQVDRNSPFSHLTADGHHHRVNFRSMSMTATVRGQDKRHLKRRPTCLDLCEDEVKLVLSMWVCHGYVMVIVMTGPCYTVSTYFTTRHRSGGQV